MSDLVVVENVNQALVMLDRAYSALIAATDFQGTRQVRSIAVAAAAFAAEAKDTRLLGAATELRSRAERQAGQMLKAAAEQGQRARKGGDQKSTSRAATLIAPTLAELGVTRDQSSDWQAVAGLSDDEFEAALETTKAVSHSISTPKVMQAAKQAKARSTPVVDTDEVEVLPAPKVASHNQQSLAFYNAVRSLGEMTCSSAELRSALPKHQHFRILDNIRPASELLAKVSITWPLQGEQEHIAATAADLQAFGRLARSITDANVSAWALMQVIHSADRATLERQLRDAASFLRNMIPWFADDRKRQLESGAATPHTVTLAEAAP